MSDENMFAAPTSNQGVSREPDDGVRYPSMMKGWAVTDLVFCSIRVPIVLLGIIGLQVIGRDDPTFHIGLGEVVSGAGMAICGIAGNIMLLRKQQRGVGMAKLCILFTIFNIVMGIGHGFIKFGDVSDSAEQIGFLIGAGTVVAVRVVLLGFYMVALRQVIAFHARLSSGEFETPEDED